ncbi:protein-L-isoaspartate(D-aspartate) O-methyltransferase (PCMT) [Promicromonospora sp. AC04]|uniref:protein-L-isoaspartate O-methyltransferase family protein n=1 Tax=Promicromonospora sp. AC04 TaxID=2135723 RepID=UPI000D3A220C|nr:hypothetical protein [Promicromonospora sp. AC04]PUB32592.1 protein-L-isoaspartate(D-aspartate) O-methyltransferase (PCMT) [Promicromonospora sp. AC04]
MISTRSTIAGTDAVANAAAAVPHAIYLGTEGDAVEPVVSRSATWRHLRALDLEADMRVLMVGTGSGYAAALAAHIVGPGGHVLTVDPSQTLTRRAGTLFAAHGHRAVAATGDPVAGHPGRGPYDRIMVHGTPASVPAAWIDQLARHGVLVTGAPISDLPGAHAVARITKTPGDRLAATVHAERYPLMERPAVAPHVMVVTAADAPRYWLASTGDDRQTATDCLKIARTGTQEVWPGGPGEFLDLKHWLLARRPRGLFTAVTEHGEGIGIGDRAPSSFGLATRSDGPPEIAMITPASFMSSHPLSPTRARLLDLIADWRAEGARATHELDAIVLHDGDAYHVRLDD